MKNRGKGVIWPGFRLGLGRAGIPAPAVFQETQMGIKKVGVLTGGGDAPGLNAAIKGVVWMASESGVEVTGILDGWQGLLDGFCDETLKLDYAAVRTWDRDGGTNIGSSRTNPFSLKEGGKSVDRSAEVVRNIRKLGLDALVAMGGEDTIGVAAKLSGLGVPVVGVPKTIDKDLAGTDYTLGFDTALRNALEIIEKSAVPASSHHWIQVVEVMGRHAGHLAFWSGVAAGAHIILIPEVPFDFDRIKKLLEKPMARTERFRQGYALIVASEGAAPKGGDMYTADGAKDSFGHVKLGGIGAALSKWIASNTKWDSRSVALGHPQRGGQPSPIDRAMGLAMGTAAMNCILKGRTGLMISAKGIVPTPSLGTVPLKDVGGKVVNLDVAKYYDEERYNLKPQVLS